jgi:hypothetical protein
MMTRELKGYFLPIRIMNSRGARGISWGRAEKVSESHWSSGRVPGNDFDIIYFPFP